jgi:hypothetical protein
LACTTAGSAMSKGRKLFSSKSGRIAILPNLKLNNDTEHNNK